jgi:hypothetical protein
MANKMQSTIKNTAPTVQRRAKEVSIKTITVNAMEALTDLTGYEASSVVSMKRDGDVWKVVLELIEKHGIPDRMDILGQYQTTLDASGNVVEYERIGLRKRGDTGSEETEERE